jgi:hypothetical protein
VFDFVVWRCCKVAKIPAKKLKGAEGKNGLKNSWLSFGRILLEVTEKGLKKIV